MEILFLILFGFIGGVLGGMGMGGGTLLIPLLTIGLKLSQQNSQAIKLLAFLPMSIIALIIHTKNKLVNYKIAIPIAAKPAVNVNADIKAIFLNERFSSGKFIYGNTTFAIIKMV